MNKFKYRLLNENDIVEISDFHRRFYEFRTEEVLQWQFFGCDLIQSGIIVGVFDDHRLIATQAYIPYIANYGGHDILSAKSELTLVDPEYRGKHLFAKMYDLGFNVCKEHKIDCIWGFTGAHNVFESVGFDTKGPIWGEYLIWNPVKFLWAEKIQPINIQTPLQLNSISLPNADDSIFNLVRDRSYISHRYLNNPNRAVALFDDTNDVLYSYGSPRPHLLLTSESSSLKSCIYSIRQLKRIEIPWCGVYKLSFSPSLSWMTLPGSIYIRKKSESKLVFKWLNTDHDIPDMILDEGLTEGL